jgi:hypothetical protein
LTSADFLSDTHPSPRAKRRTEGFYIRGASRIMRHSEQQRILGWDHTPVASVLLVRVRFLPSGSSHTDAWLRTKHKRNTQIKARALQNSTCIYSIFTHTHTHTRTHTHARTHTTGIIHYTRHHTLTQQHNAPHPLRTHQFFLVLLKTVDTKSKEIDKSRIFPHFQAHCNLLFQSAWDAGTVSLPYEPRTTLCKQHTVLS